MARQKDNGGCGLAIICLLVIIAIGQCSGGSSPSDQDAPPAAVSSALAPSTMMYVASASLNCRADPAAQSRVVEKLTRGDQVDAREAEGTWVKLDRIGEDCWVAQRFLSESPVPIETEPAAPANRLYSSPPSDGPISLASPSTARSCGAKWKCGQMDSCSEAYHYLNDCGVGRLDGDGDGVPCESIC